MEVLLGTSSANGPFSSIFHSYVKLPEGRSFLREAMDVHRCSWIFLISTVFLSSLEAWRLYLWLILRLSEVGLAPLGLMIDLRNTNGVSMCP
jgi:hypothetical protein